MGAFDDLIPGGHGGSSDMGHNEAQTREGQFMATPQLWQIGRDLATATALNKAIPGGRYNYHVQSAEQQLPTGMQSAAPSVQPIPQGWKNTDVANFQEFQGLQQSMLKPLIALTSPNNKGVSAQEMNTPQELIMQKLVTPGPEKERPANQFLINRNGKAVLDRIAFNAFSDRWRANHGTVYGKDKSGRTMQKAWADYMNTPAYKQTVLTPYTQLLANGGTPPRAGAKQVAGGNLHQGADGVYVWHP